VGDAKGPPSPCRAQAPSERLAMAALLDEFDRRAFAAVLVYRVPWSPIHRTRWTPEMLERLERGYDRAEVIGHTVVYRPRESGPRGHGNR